VPAQIREQVLGAGQQVLAAAEIEQRLTTLRNLLNGQVETLVTRIESGVRLAFSNAITAMFSASLWIILLGFVMSLFIPVISLQRPEPGAVATEEGAGAAENAAQG
jgi:hypothetical protein